LQASWTARMPTARAASASPTARPTSTLSHASPRGALAGRRPSAFPGRSLSSIWSGMRAS
jgi:hypothetical protein